MKKTDSRSKFEVNKGQKRSEGSYEFKPGKKTVPDFRDAQREREIENEMLKEMEENKGKTEKKGKKITRPHKNGGIVA